MRVPGASAAPEEWAAWWRQYHASDARWARWARRTWWAAAAIFALDILTGSLSWGPAMLYGAVLAAIGCALQEDAG